MSTNLTEETFIDTLNDTEGVSVVQFTASWCIPCRQLTPRLQELEDAGLFTYYKVDVDEASTLARDYQIMSVPTLLFIKDGELKKTLIGAKSKPEIKSELDAIS